MYLNVPYEKKDIAKQLGAKWDPERKQWFATYRKSYPDLKEFFQVPNANCILLDSIYVLIAPQNCPYCGQNNAVLTSGHGYCLELEGSFDPNYNPEFSFWNSLHIVGCTTFNNPIAKCLYHNYGYRGLRKFCISCYNPLPNYLGSSVENDYNSPFLQENQDVLQRITIYKIRLHEDVAVHYYCPISWCSNDDTILRTCKTIYLN